MLDTPVLDGSCQRNKVGTCNVRRARVVNKAGITKNERKGISDVFCAVEYNNRQGVDESTGPQEVKRWSNSWICKQPYSHVPRP
jgi:hypothetical protein